MATRVVEGKKPYTGGKAISIDENKVISLNLRDENNLIIYDEGDDEIYVDLQLPDGIEPTDAFPVGVTTGRAVVADGWDRAGTIISAKTTSGDEIKILYADDGTLWIDNGTGTFKQIYFKADVDAIVQAIRDYIYANCNTKTFLGYSASTDASKEWNTAKGQAVYDWISQGNYAILTDGTFDQWIFLPTDVTDGTISSLPQRHRVFMDEGIIQTQVGTRTITVVDGEVTGVSGGAIASNEGRIVSMDASAPSNPSIGALRCPQGTTDLKMWDGVAWQSVGGGDVLVSDQANNIFTPGMKIWGGTESDYQSLTPDSNTAYLLLAGGGGGRLPSEYQEVEYIDCSSKGPYIDTGVTYDTNGRVFQIKHSGSGGDSTSLFGNFTSWNEGIGHTRYSSSTAGIFEWDCYAGNGYGRVVYSGTAESMYEIELGNNYIKDIPTDTVLASGSTGSYTNNNDTMKIWHVDGIVDWYMTFKLYYFKIIDNGTAIRDFVPCYRKADLAVGLYDLVNDQFYTNAGTGSFTKGPNVN